MANTPGPSHWDEYNAAQRTREIRPLCQEVMDAAGPGEGRVALDLGCGLGRETHALLRDGWRVHAVDSAPSAYDMVLGTTGGDHEGRLTVHASDLAGLTAFPAADLVHAGYSLPYLRPADFAHVWHLVRTALRPGAWLAVNLFGHHDTWAATYDGTFLTTEATRDLFHGMTLVKFHEEDEDGTAYSGPKHWHLFDVIARNPL